MKQCWIFAISCVIFAGLSESSNYATSLPRSSSAAYPVNHYSRLSRSRNNDDMSIPSNLMIGAGTSAYQVEGAWNESGKGENAWDRSLHSTPGVIFDESNGDIAADTYHQYKEDVQLMKSIGLQSYRFSISWPRIVNPGCENEVNEAGIQYYRNLATELLENNIQPIVTMTHSDHPMYLEDMGGWTNELIVDYFLTYARILFERLGDLVKIWLTINEPNKYCIGAYGGNTWRLAPGKALNLTGTYLCMHNVLKAHAAVYHMYDEEFRPTQQGQIAMGASCANYVAVESNDTVSAETGIQFDCGWLYGPIYNGDYPEIMKKKVAMHSKADGCKKSRLPTFSKKWMKFIKGTSDFFALNHYTTLLVTPDPDENLKSSNRSDDSGLNLHYDPAWPESTTATWIHDVPWGFGDVLRWVKKEFNNPPVRIMENGWSDAGELDDYDRIRYHNGYMRSMLEAMKYDHCNVQSYTIWSFLDQFEWDRGYTQKFGIVGVDFNDPARTRSEKLSTAWWREVLRTRKIQPVPAKP